MLQKLLLSFIPLFIAVDALGNMPFFISLTSGMSKRQRRTALNESVSVACLLAVIFMLVGKWVLRIMNITVSDFKIAGGILLLVISIKLLLLGKNKFSTTGSEKHSVGIFPLATPLITGPAVLTTTLILLDAFGALITLISIVVNMLVVWLVFTASQPIFRFIGQAGSRAFSKISDILLAAIAVMFIRKGIIEIFF